MLRKPYDPRASWSSTRVQKWRSAVPKASKESASQEQRVEGIVHERAEELGGYTVSFDSFLGDVDGAPMLRGAPDDQCQCPHWG